MFKTPVIGAMEVASFFPAVRNHAPNATEKDTMSNIEKVKLIREKTFSPVNRINAALAKTNGDVDAAIAILVAEKQVDANDMANRVASSSIVHSYVHNHRVGAMIVLACQTDFSAKNELFLNLAKDICIHIVSTPIAPIYKDEASVPAGVEETFKAGFALPHCGKPPAVLEKIVNGKMQKWYAENCLLNQPFVKDDTKTIKQLIQEVSATIGEKVEVKRFIKIVAQ
jgi:elongation factor Ts